MCRFDPYLPSQSIFGVPYVKRLWVNRSLRMDQIEWVGFDMDYTLAIYKQAEIDRLSIEATVKKLLGRGYPAALADSSKHQVSRQIGRPQKAARFFSRSLQ